MQIPLNFKPQEIKSFDNFISGDNEVLVQSLHDFLIDDQQSLFFIWGANKSGKSHLLQALQSLLQQKHLSSVLFSSDILHDRDQLQLIPLFDHILIDDIDSVSGMKNSEENLFQWINEVKQNHKKLILTSQQANTSISWELPDLNSRLQSAQIHQIKPLNRDDLLKLFSHQAQLRGLKMEEKVIKFIEKNCSMNPGFLMSLLSQLDSITLVKKKSVTVPLIRQILDSNLVQQD